MAFSYLQRFISIFLIFIQIVSPLSLFAYTGSYPTGDNAELNIQTLIQERETYERERGGLMNVSTFSSHSEFLGSSYVIEASSRLRGEIQDRVVTSDLLYDTMIRNMSQSGIDPRSLSVQSATSQKQVLAEKKFGKQESGRVITFDFGIPDNHLIFSKPVLLSVDAGDIPDGSWVDLLVYHAGDTEYNTSGLMTDSEGECLPDGTATRPAQKAQVVNSKVSFYTCGASTFALGYVPAWDAPNATVWTLSSTPDNQVIIGGQFTTVGGVARNRVARVSTGGMLDTTFNPNVDNIVYASAVQSDGKILIGGTFTTVGGVARNRVARLNTDGTLDTTFNANITTGTQVRSIKIQSDGKILIGGTFSVLGGQTRNNIARLNANGTVDLTFVNANANGNVYAIAIQSDGKILIGGTFTTIGGNARTRIGRVSATGAWDNTFNPALTGTAVWDIKIQSDGAIVFGGQFTVVAGVARNNIARVSTLGVLDNTFNPNVTGGTPVVYTILIESSGNIIFGGTFTTVGGATTRNRIARYSSTGVLDTTLNPNAGNTVYALGKDQELNLLAGGAFTTMNAKIVAYFSWIGLNTDFTPPTIDSISLLSGSLLPIGNFSITTTYSDAGVGVNASSVGVSLQRWSGSTWESNVAATYISGIPSITTSMSTHAFAGVPYGKYRFRLYVSDIAGNQNFIERIFYIDAIEWNVSQPSVDIGAIVGNIQKNSSPDEFVITVQTVGAPFRITLSGSELNSPDSLIPHWTGVDGFGYEKYNGAYSGTLSTMEGGALIVNQPQLINTNGDKNIYTYRIQFGALVGIQHPAGDFVAPVSLQLVTDY